MSVLEKFNRQITARLPVKMVQNKSQKPIASITFDDFPHSAWRIGGKILAKYNAKATYYAVGEFCGKTIDGLAQFEENDLHEIVADGHEIASHTFDHNRVYIHSNDEIARLESENQTFFEKVLSDYSLSNFAYPYGEISPRTKMAYSELFASSRGIKDGINGKWFDLAQLKAIGIEKRHYDKARIDDFIAQAIDQNAWIIFFTHDIDENPSPYGATPQMLENTLASLKDKNIPIMTIKAALASTQF